MKVEELDAFENKADTSYEAVRAGIISKDPATLRLIEACEAELRSYLAAQHEYVQFLGTGEIPGPGMSSDAMESDALIDEARRRKADARRRFEWITKKLRWLEEMKNNQEIYEW